MILRPVRSRDHNRSEDPDVSEEAVGSNLSQAGGIVEHGLVILYIHHSNWGVSLWFQERPEFTGACPKRAAPLHSPTHVRVHRKQRSRQKSGTAADHPPNICNVPLMYRDLPRGRSGSPWETKILWRSTPSPNTDHFEMWRLQANHRLARTETVRLRTSTITYEKQEQDSRDE